MKKILIIQTAFIGDVILATPIIEKLRLFFPFAKIDFLLRKGNESLLANHPHVHKILIWDKQKNKSGNLFRVLLEIRKTKYDVVINAQRYLSTGLLSAFSGAKEIAGFDKNPFSSLFTKKIKHILGNRQHPVHEAERNLSLIEHLTDKSFMKPKIYPAEDDFRTLNTPEKYLCIAPTSVWFTKQLPAKKWIELIALTDKATTIYLLGGKEDDETCEKIRIESRRENVLNYAGKLTMLQSAALMKGANMNYVNDSAPLHLASAVNAPVTAVFCSTVPEFGFTPLSDLSKIVETKEELDCRPCGLHGFRACPRGHFKCAQINAEDIL